MQGQGEDYHRRAVSERSLPDGNEAYGAIERAGPGVVRVGESRAKRQDLKGTQAAASAIIGGRRNHPPADTLAMIRRQDSEDVNLGRVPVEIAESKKADCDLVLKCCDHR